MARSPAEGQSDLEKLKVVAQKAAKSVNDIVKMVEGASDLKIEAVDAVFENISHLLLIAHQRARLSLNLALAANGAADLTEKLPDITPVNPTLAPVLTVPLAQPVRERIVGESKRKAAVDDDADVDFIEE